VKALSGLSYKETENIVPPRTIMLGYMGSIAHGTHIPSTDPNSIDDKDIMGVCIADERVYFGLKRFEQKEVKYKEWDSVVYEIGKFFRLLLKGNPNVLGLLWLREPNYIWVDPTGKKIIDNKHLFVSKDVYYSFSGYAHGQLHRMTHNACQGYVGQKRKKLVEEFGYDCKNAAHLIRLLRMGIEFLMSGELHVFREDAAELKDIKTGKWTLEKVKSTADDLFKLAQEAFVKSPLPPKPEYEKAEQLLIDIMRFELGYIDV
jgi:predicted nucleotidyltransferase